MNLRVTKSLLGSANVDGRGSAYNLNVGRVELNLSEARGRERLGKVSSSIAFPVSSNKVASHMFDDFKLIIYWMSRLKFVM